MCKPGECQFLRLRPVNNLLCPVEAIKRRLIVCKKFGLKTLFSYQEEGTGPMHLTKDTATRILGAAWASGGITSISGHSFRVGGASFRAAVGVSTQEICLIGRWISNCYKLYIRPYSQEEVEESANLMAELNEIWEAQTKEQQAGRR
jgi:hypothetical protein